VHIGAVSTGVPGDKGLKTRIVQEFGYCIPAFSRQPVFLSALVLEDDIQGYTPQLCQR